MRGQLGLKGLNFFTAAVQAGFGPFIAVWLTQQGWTVAALGVALSVGTFAALLCQLPGGMLVDHIHPKRFAALGALMLMGLSAIALCMSSSAPVVWGAEVGHALASSVMTPTIAALTFVTCGHSSFGERLGLNTRYAALGSAMSAALLGAAASYFSERAVFLVTAALVVPAIMSAFAIQPASDLADDHPALSHPKQREHKSWLAYKDRRMHIFAASIVLFQLANAALLPLAVSDLTRRNDAPGYLVSAMIIVPQAITAIFAPAAGRLTQRIGRRPVLIAGFAAVSLRALLFATSPGAVALVVYQALDGISAAVLGLMLPLIAADLTRRTGHLNLAIGSFGLAAGLGATFSTIIAGWIAQHFGAMVMFLILAAVAASAIALILIAMPETGSLSKGPKQDAQPAHAKNATLPA